MRPATFFCERWNIYIERLLTVGCVPVKGKSDTPRKNFTAVACWLSYDDYRQAVKNTINVEKSNNFGYTHRELEAKIAKKN